VFTADSGSARAVTFNEAVDYPTGGGPFSIRIADLTGDGHRDPGCGR
jgi:hypothetical protein